MTHLPRILHKLSHLIVPLVLLCVVAIIGITNYRADAFLSGWDNLQQEFDFELNWERHTFATWQEYQGLGLPAAMAHASDFPRLLVTTFVSNFVPVEQVRYVYMLFCLYLGSLGIYYFTRWLLNQPQKRLLRSLTPRKRNAIALLSALFAVLNLGTLLVFFNPIEMFPTQWAYLPWLLLFCLRLLQVGNAKDYFIFAVLSFFAAPMAYTPTLFVVYAGVLVIVGMAQLISSLGRSGTFGLLKRLCILGFITFAVNSFWLLPFIYNFATDRGQTIKDAQINEFISDEIFARNRDRGSLTDVMLLRGFTFDNADYDVQTGTYIPMMGVWNEHLDMWYVQAIGYTLFAVVVMGLVTALATRSKFGLSIAILLAVVLFLLINSNAPTGFVFDWLRSISSVFAESFRFPYTKIIQLAVVIYAVLFGFGLAALDHVFKRLVKVDVFLALSLVVPYILLIFMLPVFNGYFFYPELHVDVPDEYFEMFAWFKTQPQTVRIANIPQTDFMNWYHYRWGYRGSGFLWYGIKQPILDRSFDVWSGYNEQYFREMYSAIYGNDVAGVKQVMQKYRIGWLLYDKSLRTPTSALATDTQRRFYETEFLPGLLEDKAFKEVAAFGENIRIIAYQPVVDNSSPVAAITDPAYVYTDGTATSGNYQDSVYANYGNYVEQPEAGTSTLVNSSKDLQERLTLQSGVYAYRRSFNGSAAKITIPAYWSYASWLPVEVTATRHTDAIEVKLTYVTPIVTVNGSAKTTRQTESFMLPVDQLQQYILRSPRDVVDLTSLRTAGDTTTGYLAIGKTDTIAVFELTNLLQVAQLDQAKCAEATLPDKLNYSGSSVTIATKSKGCVAFSLPQDELTNIMQVSFPYSSAQFAIPSVCLRTATSCNRVINVDPLYPGAVSTRTLTKFMAVRGHQPRKLEITLENSFGSETGTTANLGLPVVSYYRKIRDLTPIFIDTEITISSGRVQELGFEFPQLTQSSLANALEMNTTIEKSRPANCHGYESGVRTIPQIQRSYDSGTNSASYHVVNAIACDEIWTGNDYRTDMDYILTTTSTFVQGQVPEIHVINDHFSSTMWKYLLPNQVGAVATQHVLIPRVEAGSQGLRMRLWLTSRGNFASEMALHGLQVQFLPLQYLTNTRVETWGRVSSISTDKLQVTEVERVAPFWYRATVSGSGTLVLHQAYHPGWYVFGTNSSTHARVNGWENGWFISAGDTDTITIVYVPEVLAAGGFALAYLVLLSLLLRWRETAGKE